MTYTCIWKITIRNLNTVDERGVGESLTSPLVGISRAQLSPRRRAQVARLRLRICRKCRRLYRSWSNGIHSDRASTPRCDDEIRIVLRVRRVRRNNVPALYAPTSSFEIKGGTTTTTVLWANVFPPLCPFLFFLLPQGTFLVLVNLVWNCSRSNMLGLLNRSNICYIFVWLVYWIVVPIYYRNISNSSYYNKIDIICIYT